MSIQETKSKLEEAFQVLMQQASATSENWKDEVQRRFYDQFVNAFPREFSSFIKSLEEVNNKFEKAEQQISQLLEEDI